MTEQRAVGARNVLLGSGKHLEGIPEGVSLTQETKRWKSRNGRDQQLIGTWVQANANS